MFQIFFILNALFNYIEHEHEVEICADLEFKILITMSTLGSGVKNMSFILFLCVLLL